MSDRPLPSRAEGALGDRFEQRLFALVESGELDFPQGLMVPPEPEHRLRDWLGRLAGGPLLPALAYALVLAMAVPAYRGLLARPPAAAPAATAPSAVSPLPTDGRSGALPRTGAGRVLDLGTGSTRGGRAPAAVVLGDGDGFLVLSFLVPVKEGAAYGAAIRDAAGRTVAEERPLRSLDALGNFVLVCRSDLFRGGKYVLLVSRVDAGQTNAGEEYALSFDVTRSAR